MAPGLISSAKKFSIEKKIRLIKIKLPRCDTDLHFVGDNCEKIADVIVVI